MLANNRRYCKVNIMTKAYKIKSVSRYIPDGEKIKSFRESKGFSLRKTAIALDISATYLHLIEAGKIKGVSVGVAQKIDKLFDGKIVPKKRQY